MKMNGYHIFAGEENARLRKGARGGRTRKPALRLLSAALSLSMLLTGCGPASLTSHTEIPNGVEQIESALQQTVPLGTAVEDLTMPDTLEAYIVEKDAENSVGGGETSQRRRRS